MGRSPPRVTWAPSSSPLRSKGERGACVDEVGDAVHAGLGSILGAPSSSRMSWFLSPAFVRSPSRRLRQEMGKNDLAVEEIGVLPPPPMAAQRRRKGREEERNEREVER